MKATEFVSRSDRDMAANRPRILRGNNARPLLAAASPTNGTEVSTDHVVVARGRDYEDVPPFKGIYSGRAAATLDVSVAITRLA